jgi:hypothetical protein
VKQTTAKKKTTVKKKPPVKHSVTIPALVTSVKLRTTGQIGWAQVHAQFAPHVQLSITLLGRNLPRQQLFVATDARGQATHTFRVTRPAPHKYITLQIRVWGVYSHHRRTKVVKVKMLGAT